VNSIDTYLLVVLIILQWLTWFTLYMQGRVKPLESLGRAKPASVGFRR